MIKNPREVYVIGSNRVPFAKSQTAYMDVTRNDLMCASLNGLVERFELQGQTLSDVALGAVMNSSADWNLARECVLDTKLNPETPAYNVQRACGTSLETVWQLGLKIAAGQADIAIAGGVDTNSDLPIEVSEGLRKALLQAHTAKTFLDKLNPFLTLGPKALIPKTAAVYEPRTKLSMGESCEIMVKEWKISRQAQDELALRSHKNAARAYEEGFFKDLVQPFHGVSKDLTIRPDTTLEKLAKLKPAFDPVNGTITAGNSSPLTDGSACVLLASKEQADKNKWKPLARLVDFQAAAVDFVHGAGLLMAPTIAVAKLLARNQMQFSDFAFIEIHEAFAGQVLCNQAAWNSADYCKKVLSLSSPLGPIDQSRLNVHGSSIALGHPFAATGARITGTLAKMLSGKKGRGLISICTAGGMGVTAILESVD
jgi:acetyl-CoA C-acetyltransferase